MGMPLPAGIECCCGSCVIGADDFNRANENPVTGTWSTIGGAWSISANQLVNLSEGVLITTLIQPAPVNSTKYTYRIRFSINETATNWKIICKYINSTSFDWVELLYIGIYIYPKFWRRVSNVDTLLMDPFDYPAGNQFEIPGGGILPFTICYSSNEWSITSGIGSYNWVDCEAIPATALPAGSVGFVGFLKGNFDDFSYEVHWESDNNCLLCTCFCDDGIDSQCIPEDLLLTLTPTTIHIDCTTNPETISLRLRQSLPTEPATPPPIYRASPEKKWWFSDPVLDVQDGTRHWFRLECLSRGAFELILMLYPNGSSSPVITVARTVIQFQNQNGSNSGSLSVTTLCNPIVITFGAIQKYTLQIGSPGPFFCTPYAALIYSAIVTEYPTPILPPMSPFMADFGWDTSNLIEDFIT